MHRRRINGRINGVYTKFFDVLNPIPNAWYEKACHIIKNWNADGSIKRAHAAIINPFAINKAISAIVTPTEIMLYDLYHNEIVRLTRED